jgi:hypothetical protein
MSTEENGLSAVAAEPLHTAAEQSAHTTRLWLLDLGLLLVIVLAVAVAALDALG